MTLKSLSLAITALVISASVVHGSDDLRFKDSTKLTAGARVCLNCPPNSTVCYPNTCDDHGCHVTGQACSITGHATGCPPIPFC
jgi:hypothetical protein